LKIGPTTLLLAAVTALGACRGSEAGNNVTGTEQAAARPAAAKGTLADALGQDGTTRFAAAVKTAAMEPVLKGPGPYTVLIPTDAAFGAAGDLGTDKAALTKLIGGHILPGTVLIADISKAIDAHNGTAKLKTMAGTTLTATRSGNAIKLADSAGGAATITTSDTVYSNGVAHRIDAVLKPKS
jgi:uncharacterized surface protein with fasciclin (FAS1) repeats